MRMKQAQQAQKWNQQYEEKLNQDKLKSKALGKDVYVNKSKIDKSNVPKNNQTTVYYDNASCVTPNSSDSDDADSDDADDDDDNKNDEDGDAMMNDPLLTDSAANGNENDNDDDVLCDDIVPPCHAIPFLPYVNCLSIGVSGLRDSVCYQFTV